MQPVQVPVSSVVRGEEESRQSAHWYLTGATKDALKGLGWAAWRRLPAASLAAFAPWFKAPGLPPPAFSSLVVPVNTIAMLLIVSMAFLAAISRSWMLLWPVPEGGCCAGPSAWLEDKGLRATLILLSSSGKSGLGPQNTCSLAMVALVEGS